MTEIFLTRAWAFDHVRDLYPDFDLARAMEAAETLAEWVVSDTTAIGGDEGLDEILAAIQAASDKEH